jgi:hypothetical protein
MKKIEVIENFLGLNKGSILYLNEKTNKYEYSTEDSDVSQEREYHSTEYIGVNQSVVNEYIDIYFRDISDEPIGDELDWETASYIKPRVVQMIPQDGDNVILRNTDKGEVMIPAALFTDLFKVIE